MKRSLKAFLIFWLPPIAWASAIFYFSSLSRPPAPCLFPNFDKFLHLSEYLILAFLLTRALKRNSGLRAGRSIIFLAAALTILYGAADEVHQYFTAERSCSFLDWIADSIGAILGTAVYFKINIKNDSN